MVTKNEVSFTKLLNSPLDFDLHQMTNDYDLTNYYLLCGLETKRFLGMNVNEIKTALTTHFHCSFTLCCRAIVIRNCYGNILKRYWYILHKRKIANLFSSNTLNDY